MCKLKYALMIIVKNVRCIHFCFSVESLDFNVTIHFRELPMEYEQHFRKQIWSLRNLTKPLPNSLEAKRHMQKLKQAEKESAERKKLLRLKKKEAIKAMKKEADEDGREEAQEEIHIPEVDFTCTSCKVRKWEARHDFL